MSRQSKMRAKREARKQRALLAAKKTYSQHSRRQKQPSANPNLLMQDEHVIIPDAVAKAIAASPSSGQATPPTPLQTLAQDLIDFQTADFHRQIQD